MVRAWHRYGEVTGSNPLKIINISCFYIRNYINCVYNCEDHSLLENILHKTYVGYVLGNYSTRNVCNMKKTWEGTNALINQ